MICYRLAWTDNEGMEWYNLFDTMHQALEYAASRPLEEVLRIDIQKCSISNLADTQPIPVGKTSDSGDEMHG